jgi:hypothetical protein
MVRQSSGFRRTARARTTAATTGTIDHPDVGLITLDCDTLIVAADDLRIMIYTAEPGTEDSERLALAVVLGTQAFMS